MSFITVLTLDSEKIQFLLSNHKFFSAKEITLAAKIKVINDKKAEYAARASLQEIRDSCNQRAAMTIANNAYNDGYNGSLQECLLGTRLF